MKKIARLRLLNGIPALPGVDSVVAREDVLIERLDDGSGDYVVRLKGKPPIIVPHHVVHFAFADTTPGRMAKLDGTAPVGSA